MLQLLSISDRSKSICIIPFLHLSDFISSRDTCKVTSPLSGKCNQLCCSRFIFQIDIGLRIFQIRKRIEFRKDTFRTIIINKYIHSQLKHLYWLFFVHLCDYLKRVSCNVIFTFSIKCNQLCCSIGHVILFGPEKLLRVSAFDGVY